MGQTRLQGGNVDLLECQMVFLQTSRCSPLPPIPKQINASGLGYDCSYITSTKALTSNKSWHKKRWKSPLVKWKLNLILLFQLFSKEGHQNWDSNQIYWPHMINMFCSVRYSAGHSSHSFSYFKLCEVFGKNNFNDSKWLQSEQGYKLSRRKNTE